MKNILILSMTLFVLSLQAQSETFDTTYISFNTTDSVYLLTSVKHYDDFSQITTVKPIGNDSASVILYLRNDVETRERKEARGVLEAYNYSGLSSTATLLKDFSGDTYSKNIISKHGDRFTGQYKVWISGTAYDAEIKRTASGNMRLYIPDVSNYTILLLSKNSFTVKNYTPESVDFYFTSDNGEKRIYMNNDFDKSWRIKYLRK